MAIRKAVRELLLGGKFPLDAEMTAAIEMQQQEEEEEEEEQEEGVQSPQPPPAHLACSTSPAEDASLDDLASRYFSSHKWSRHHYLSLWGWLTDCVRCVDHAHRELLLVAREEGATGRGVSQAAVANHLFKENAHRTRS